MTSDREKADDRDVRVGTALAAPDGRYIDADPATLDIYGVTLDVLRDKRIGDFSPPEFADLTRHLWNLWVMLGLEHGEGGGTVVRGDGSRGRLWIGLQRQPDGNVRLRLKPVDEPLSGAPAMRVQTLLGQWRELERDLVELPPDDAAREKLERRIDSLREEYQRRTAG